MRTHTSSPTPSPPPTAPIASTPGLRAAALQKIFLTALTSSLKANSYANFSACFPTTAQHCPGALEGVWKQLNAKLEEGCVREFDAILQERGVVESLNLLDGLVGDARRRMNRGVEGEMGEERRLHTLSGQELYSAHLTPYLENATHVLETRLHSTQQTNGQLMEQLTAQSAEIERLLERLEGKMRDVEASVEAMSKDCAHGLRDEVWAMDEDVKSADAAAASATAASRSVQDS